MTVPKDRLGGDLTTLCDLEQAASRDLQTMLAASTRTYATRTLSARTCPASQQARQTLRLNGRNWSSRRFRPVS